MSKYYVSHENQQLGPWGLDEIVAKIKAEEVSPLDYIYDESSEDWVLLMEYEPLSSKIKDVKPKAPPKPTAAPGPEDEIAKAKKAKTKKKDKPMGNGDLEKEWFILKGENKFGPFSYTDVIKMLQQGVVYEFDFAWHNGLENWQRVAEVEAFSHDKIKQLKDTLMPEISEVFFRRRHRRALYGGTILIHDNKKLWKGQGVEISAGGAGVVMENAMVVPGQQLYLHFKPGDGVPPFNAVCEVVSKRFVDKVKNENEAVRYGLKFLTISAEAKKFLTDFTKNAKAAA